MINIIKSLFSMPPLESYEIPKNRKTETAKQAPVKNGADEQGFKGSWKMEENVHVYEAVNMNKTKDATGSALDQFDLVALKEKGIDCSKAEISAKATLIKKYRANDDSAQTIAKRHDGQRGWSNRTIDDYIAALNAASEERNK
jgi:hypothetical protein